MKAKAPLRVRLKRARRRRHAAQRRLILESQHEQDEVEPYEVSP